MCHLCYTYIYTERENAGYAEEWLPVLSANSTASVFAVDGDKVLQLIVAA